MLGTLCAIANSRDVIEPYMHQIDIGSKSSTCIRKVRCMYALLTVRIVQNYTDNTNDKVVNNIT